jgi:uncharacterized protein YjbJ (UPF0337 family)
MGSGTEFDRRRPHFLQEKKMDWQQIEENWKHVKQKIAEKWDKLTEGDLDAINGRRDRLEARISKRYGFAADHVHKEVDDWLRWQTTKSQLNTRAKHTHGGHTSLLKAKRSGKQSHQNVWL